MSAAEREPCTCPQCYQAGVSTRPQVKSWKSGEWLHGYELKRVIEARDAFWRVVNAQFKRAEREQ